MYGRETLGARGAAGAVNQEESPDLPVLDDSVLALLRAETDYDDGIWKVFVRDFIDQMPPRIEKIRSTLTSGDGKGAMAAVLSLRTSAQMVGAMQLAGVALELEEDLRCADNGSDPAGALPGLAAKYLRRITYAGQRTTDQLELFIG